MVPRKTIIQPTAGSSLEWPLTPKAARSNCQPMIDRIIEKFSAYFLASIFNEENNFLSVLRAWYVLFLLIAGLNGLLEVWLVRKI